MKRPLIWLAALTILALVTTWLFRRKLIAMADSAWKWPVPGYTSVSSRFGNRTHPVTGAQGSFHNGIDIPAPIGTMVVAPASGRVKSVYYNATGGNQLVIVHDNGYQTGYAHLSQTLVEEGEYVSQGEPIAMVGNTGGSTGPHLHFTARPKPTASPIDPSTLFA